MELPLLENSAVRWTVVRVPAGAPSSLTPCCPRAIDVGGGATLSSSPSAPRAATVVWRIHAESSKVLEIIEISSHQDLHRRGLHLLFEEDLTTFACVVPSQIPGKAQYVVWVLTVGGVIYRVHVTGAAAGWMLCGNQQHDASVDIQRMHEVTAFAVTPNVFCLGGQTGSIICVPFGTGSPSTSGAESPFELKDADHGIRGLWGFVSRGKSAGSVRSLVARLVNGSFFLFALHEDGTLRLWDLLHRYRVLNHPLSTERELEDFEPKLMWVKETLTLSMAFQIALLCNSSDTSRETVFVCSVAVGPGEGAVLRQGFITVQHMISLPEGKVIDLKLLEAGVWTLQSTKKSHELLFSDFSKEGSLEVVHMLEKSVAEQLMQVPGDEWSDFLYTIHPTLGVSSKLKLSDVFLRRVFQPGVRQPKALQEALEQHGRPISDSDLASVSLDALRSHIFSAIESESCGDSQAQILYGWMRFSGDYVRAWTHFNKPYSILLDANTNSVGLIRRSSVALVRALTDVEQFSPGGHISNRATLPDEWKNFNKHEQIILLELSSCAKLIVDHLGRVAMGLLYESFLRPVDQSVPGILPSLARILDLGFNSSLVADEIGHMGVDEIRSKEQDQHRRQRAFALHIAHALQTLQSKAGGWDKLFQIISKYVDLLALQSQPMLTSTGSTKGMDSGLIKRLLSQSTSQIAWAQFKAARDLLLLLVYSVKVGIQVGLTSNQISFMKSHTIPRIQEIMTMRLLVHWLTVTFAEVPPAEDFSSQLSSLRLDGTSSRIGSGFMVSGESTLGEMLVSTFLESDKSSLSLPEGALPDQDMLLSHSWQFVKWLLLGENGKSSQGFPGRAISLSNILLQHGQYSSLERFLTTIEQFSSQQKLAEGTKTADGLWSARLHLLGFCLLAQARTELKNNGKEIRVAEAIRYFFRAASGLGEANEDLQFVLGTGYQQNLPGIGAAAAWRLHYYEWVMQIFEQYNLSEGACQFAHAALEQVDEAVGKESFDNVENPFSDTLVVAIRGRLWANIFKFSLDLDLYSDAYCAIISNPDEESKYICLRRFIVVLCERKATQVLCAQEVPYVGLLEKVVQELLWKAENSDISAKPSPYKLLYSLHMQRHNWRRAAACMYRYAVRVREESRTPNLQEEVHGILAAINALQLVDPINAWFELVPRPGELPAPSKRQRLTATHAVPGSSEKRDKKACRAVDLEDLEKEYALTKARLQLAHSEVKHLVIGGGATPEEVVWSLIQCRLYETAFSILFLFWKDSLLKRELEKIMDVMARNCCLLQIQEVAPGSLLLKGEPVSRLLLTSGSQLADIEENHDKNGEDEREDELPSAGTARTAWLSLQQYLEKYRSFHPRLPVIVAESILNVDKHMELPLWLVNIFKGGKEAGASGMAGGKEAGADPAALLRIYLDFDRLAEATALVLEYIRAWSSLKPADVIKRKRMCAVWFPYTVLDRLQNCLSKSSDMAVRDKLQDSLKFALQNHFKLLKADSDDVKASI
ncbi:nuclear pore complex protein NUP160 isoform X1 [Physcomitrium patens]|uniref:Uncharacterized protein n=1 Tax=Physcomitrium patens TaxID=3218 RepID=A0A2K1JWG8_PHYPA|nr:nuclear pore complex protein NUP160-like isoform X1 [Physcomitrium patens]PNR45854.1 hypothetical protein PHYPA_015625 [Physcomitrium patens]|eukprot:XP_024389835.1 nuclear pore complex protein NUP160-like isoform X1 [Physcomitrella patens]